MMWMVAAFTGCQVRDKIDARPDARTDFTPRDAALSDAVRMPDGMVMTDAVPMMDAAPPMTDAAMPTPMIDAAPAMPDVAMPDAAPPMTDAAMPTPMIDAAPALPDAAAPPDAAPPLPDAAMPDAAMPDAAIPDAAPPLADAAPPPDGPTVPLLGPDLTLLSDRMAASIVIRDEFIDGNSCALNECLTAFGVRTLLRFETAAYNAGTVAMVMGPPIPSAPQWDYDSCHMHYHYLDFAEYQLVDERGTVVAMGHKQSFCVRDDIEVVSGAPSAGYDCQVQGLSAGWADVYSNNLDCQYVDVTGVPPGTYALRIELNPARRIVETNYDNNVATFPVVVP